MIKAYRIIAICTISAGALALSACVPQAENSDAPQAENASTSNSDGSFSAPAGSALSNAAPAENLAGTNSSATSSTNSTSTSTAANTAPTSNAAPAENLAGANSTATNSANSAATLPTAEVLAPQKYRRPEGYTPVLYPKTLHEISDEYSKKMMRSARKQLRKVREVNEEGPYKATAAGMDSHTCPEWFIDAKLGMFIDWGLYSIASYSPYIKGERLYPDWYEKSAFQDHPEGHPDYGFHDYHIKNWGADFQRDHFIDLFRGRDFNAPLLARIFRECGAKYVVPVLKHHSGFCEWDCSYTFRDSWDQGAHRDFAREMADAFRAEGLKFGVYNSQADEWEYPILREDGTLAIKKWGGEIVDYTPDMEYKASGKVAVKDFVYDYIVPQMTEFIDKYDPDIMWYDADWSTRASENGSYDITAYMYNKAEGRKEVCCNDRFGRLEPDEEKAYTQAGIKLIGCRTIRGDFYTDEWGDTAENIDPAKYHPWESCSGISKCYGNHWMEEFDPSMVMTDREFIIHFMDIVSRGGNLVLLVNLDGQGALPQIQKERILSIGRWLSRWGEGVYATRIIYPFCTPTIDYTRSKDGLAVYATVKDCGADGTAGADGARGAAGAAGAAGGKSKVINAGPKGIPSRAVELEYTVPGGALITVLGDKTPLPYHRTSGKEPKTTVFVPIEYTDGELPYILKIR